MCGKSTTVRQQGKTKPPKYVAEAYRDIVKRATGVADQPYVPYNGQLVAGLTDRQRSGFDAVSAARGAGQPYLTRASDLSMAGSAAVNPMEFSDEAIAKYMNPFLDSVVGKTLDNINNANEVQRQGVVGNSIARGAWGGDRAGVAQAELARNQALSRDQTIAQLLSQGFGQALGMFNTQQAVNLSAGQNTAARALQGAQLQGALGEQAMNQALQGATAEIQAGSLEQQQGQNELNAEYQQWQNARAFPFQSVGWLGNIVTGVGNNAGGTTSGSTTTPAPSLLSGFLGLGTAAMGAISDERAKEGVAPVGMTFDGQPIYRFRYKGSPQTQIGLMAQDVEQAYPEAVGRAGPLKTVDYDAATRHAAERGHFAAGGGVAPAGIPYGAGEMSAYIPIAPFIGGRGANLPSLPALPQQSAGASAGSLLGGTTPGEWEKFGQSARKAYDTLSTPKVTPQVTSLVTPTPGGLYARGGAVPGYAEGGATLYDENGNPIGISGPTTGTLPPVPPMPRGDRAPVSRAAPDAVRVRTTPVRGEPDTFLTGNPEPVLPRPAAPPVAPPPGLGGAALPPIEDKGVIPSNRFNGAFSVYGPGAAEPPRTATVSGQPRTIGTAEGRAAAEGRAPLVAAMPEKAGVAAAAFEAPQPSTPGAALATAASETPAGVAASQPERIAQGRPPAPPPGPVRAAASRLLETTGLTGFADRATTALSDDGKGGRYAPTPVGRIFGMESGLFSPEVRSALMAAGFGMMAGKDRNAFVNIGTGGLAGVNQYNTATTLNQGQQRIDTELKRLEQEKYLREIDQRIAQQNADTLATKPPGYHVNLASGKSITAIPDENGVLRVTQTGPSQGGPAPVKSADTLRRETETTVQPPQTVVRPDAAAAPPAAPVAPVAPADIGTDRDPAISAPPLRPYQGGNDNRLFIPQVAPIAEREIESVRKMAEDDLQAYRTSDYRLREMRALLEKMTASKSDFFGPGTTAELRGNLGAALVDAMGVLGLKKSVGDIEKAVGNIEEFRKLSNTMASEMAAGGGQEAFAALMKSIESVPNVTMTESGIRRILTAAEMVNERRADFANFVTQAMNRTIPPALAQVRAEFDKERPPSFYADRALLKSIPEEHRRQFLELGGKRDQDRYFDGLYGKGASAALRRVYRLENVQ